MIRPVRCTCSTLPEAATQAMRALLRTRMQPVRGQASPVQRIRKALEDAKLRLGSAPGNVVGVSGQAILAALIAGETDPDRLLALAGSISSPALSDEAAAWEGQGNRHHAAADRQFTAAAARIEPKRRCPVT